MSLLPAIAATLAMTCNPPVRSTLPRPPTPDEMAELWIEPTDLQRRDLYSGPGGPELAPPKRGAAFKFKAYDTKGYSRGYDVIDADGRAWSVKIGPEAQPEVVASRLYWAIGYHQPPTYFVPEWRMTGHDEGPKESGRFRPEPKGWTVVADWDLHENPFVGTQPYRGLLVMNLIVNSWDVKPSQNKISEAENREIRPRRMYLVRDLGATFGRPRWPSGSRNNVEHYEKHPFIKRVEGDRIQFAYYGRHDELLRQIRPADVCWTTRLVDRLTPQQKRDAFRAASYAEDLAERFIRRFDQKVAEGLKLCGARP